jgi:hypothetical protein
MKHSIKAVTQSTKRMFYDPLNSIYLPYTYTQMIFSTVSESSRSIDVTSLYSYTGKKELAPTKQRRRSTPRVREKRREEKRREEKRRVSRF